MADILTGLFPDRASAERGIADLTSAGFDAHLMSIPSDQAGYYQGRVEQGSVLVAVETQDRAAEAQRILLHSGALKLGPEGTLEGDQAQDDSIGGVTPAAVTDAPPEPDARAVPLAGEDGIGGVTPAAVSNAAPRQLATGPADSTIVTPGMEIPYTERQAQQDDVSQQHPITDDDIIAEAERQRQREQSADLDVAP